MEPIPGHLRRRLLYVWNACAYLTTDGLQQLSPELANLRDRLETVQAAMAPHLVPGASELLSDLIQPRVPIYKGL